MNAAMFRSLRVRNYRLFAGGQVVSLTGTWMQRVAQDWLVLDLSHNSGTALGVTTALQFLPLLLFGLYGGVLADRYPKRRLLLWTQTAMGALALLLGVLDLTGTVRLWHVYALAFGLGLATVVDNPTRQAFVMELVGREDLPNAVALNSATFNAGRVVGPAVAGLLINSVGTGWVFLVNALSFGGVLTGLLLMRERELHAGRPAPRERGQLVAGLRYVKARPTLMLPMVLVTFIATFGLNFQITTALMAKLVFHRGAGSYGLLATAVAVGSLVGALFAAARSQVRQRLLIAAALAFSVLEVVAGLMPTYLTFLLLLLPTGAAILTFTTSANSLIQLGSSAAMRGRVMALYMTVFFGGTPLGAPLIGWIAQRYGARWSLLGGGAICLVATVVASLLYARRRHVTVVPHLRPRPHLHVSTDGAAAAELPYYDEVRPA